MGEPASNSQGNTTQLKYNNDRINENDKNLNENVFSWKEKNKEEKNAKISLEKCRKIKKNVYNFRITKISRN